MLLDNYELLLTGKMDKTMTMFQMLEHPTEYTTEQWQEVLSDPICKDLYATLSMTAGAFYSQQASDSLTDDDIKAEWSLLKDNHHKTKIYSLSWHNVAAIVSCLLILTGMTWAAVQTDFGGLFKEVITPSEMSATPEVLTSAPAIVTFDNVTIEQVISDLTTFYSNNDGIRYEAIFDNDDVKNIRLFYRWDNSLSLQQVVDKLDHFEKLEVRLEGPKIFIEQALSD